MLKNKIEFPILICIFVMTLGISSLFRTSINEVDANTLAKDISGIGEVKSAIIIKERDLNGKYTNFKDFVDRTKKYGGIGEVVINRVNKKYKF